jgi:NADPH:quinone reductase
VQAAALPAAGLAALRALAIAGLVPGKRVLVAGAAGGAGRMAVQLAYASGAHVTALVRDAAASGGLMGRLGAAAVAGHLAGEFDVIIDGAGGATSGLAIEHLCPRGVVVNIAAQDDEEDEELVSFTRLCALAAGGRLDGQVELQCSGRQPEPAIGALLNRRTGGKVVLCVD